MCGIAGIAARTPFNDRDLLTTMRDSMTHRGPDDAGSWWSADGRVGLSQRRLAIIDLSPGGHQPMSDHSGHMMADSLDSAVAIPFAFPKAGAYSVWVQFKRAGTIETAAFDTVIR